MAKTWITRTLDGWRTADRHRREYAELASLPDWLLYDMGLSRDGVPSLARQLRAKARH